MSRMLDRDLRFRNARPEDVDDLVTIGRDTFVETFGNLYGPTDLKTYLDETFSASAMAADIDDPAVDIRLAEGAGGLVAYAKVAPLRLPVDPGDRKVAELHRLYVREARQGLGVGRILLTWTIQRARDRGADDLYLGVWSGNSRAIAVYEGRGFEKVGTYDYYVGNHRDDELIMRLKLAD